MKRLSITTALFLIGFALIVVSNILALAGVLINRAAPLDAQITLSERELTLPYTAYWEDSGLSLDLNWRILDKDASDIYATGRWGQPEWLDKDKLAALGFDDRILREYRAYERGTYKYPLPQKVFIVLELGGSAHAEAIKRADEALARFENDPDENRTKYIRERAKNERETLSRLFAIDAGLDPEALRTQYPDPSRFLILKGAIEPRVYFKDNVRTLSGYINNLSVTSLNVPLNLRPVLDAIRGGKGSHRFIPPRFSVDLKVGARYEPWIEAIHHTDTKQAQKE